MTDSEASYNVLFGVIAQDASTVTMSNTTVTHNDAGIIAGGTGVLDSFQDNRVSGNVTNDATFTNAIGKT